MALQRKPANHAVGGAPSTCAAAHAARALQGVVKAPCFRKFKSEALHSEAAARSVLAGAGVEHYWDLCAAFHPDQ